MKQNRFVSNKAFSLNEIARYYILVIACTVPFWILGAITGAGLLPDLPIAALSGICPLIAACVVAYRYHGRTGPCILLSGAFDARRIRSLGWLGLTIALMPIIMVASYIIQRLSGEVMPYPSISLASSFAIIALFFAGGIAEEIGWTGFALDGLQRRLGAIKASLIIGIAWSIWHWPALLQAHRSLAWIAWWSLATVAMRFIMVWLYNAGGRSVFLVAMFHMMTNLVWQWYPVNGSHYNLAITGPILATVGTTLWLLFPKPEKLSNKTSR